MANNLVSPPVVPAQPHSEFYNIQDLVLFKAYSRDSYRSAFGLEAAAYDPTRLLKSWFDSTVDVSDPGNVAVYRERCPTLDDATGRHRPAAGGAGVVSGELSQR